MKIVKRLLIAIVILFVVIIAAAITLPIVFKGKLLELAKTEINKNVNAQVDFADVNGDQYLDAVLRFVPIGPGVARAPLTLPLTRTEPEGPFHVPQLDSAPPPITPLEDR